MWNPLSLWSLYKRGQAASRYAADRSLPGMVFNRFGREVGRRLLWRGDLRGIAYLLTPVSSFRYFEFPFALAALPPRPGRCLDVASPRLFSLYVARTCSSCFVDIMNPDPHDLEETRKVARCLGTNNLGMHVRAVEALDHSKPAYDCIWSLSVVEHIPEEGADTEAVGRLYSLLRAGGRLILTVPVDRRYWIEWRENDYYGTAGEPGPQGYFFQRYYDNEALRRLLSKLPRPPCQLRWFGERIPGHFEAYERRWMREGHRCTVEDPREIVDYYQEYASWADMPGRGVCGLVIQK